MPQDSKEPGLSWSTPKSDTPAPAAAPAADPPAATLGFPSSKKPIQTQAPVYASLLVAGIIIGVLLATAWSSDTDARDGGAGSVSSTSTTKVLDPAPAPAAPIVAATPTDPPLVVLDQPAGASVSINRLNLAQATWVVVYVSREGKPGNALGARLYFPADKQGSIGLLRNTEPGQRYIVGLSVDNGDHIFSLSKDKPLADADGGPLWATFTAR